MKRFFTLLALLAAVVMPFVAKADTMDDQGYPVFYLRGSMNYSDWGAHDQYKFSRTENFYKLFVSELSDEFKISGDEWHINYGANFSVERLPCEADGVQNGYNISCPGLQNVWISFYYTPGSDTTILFSSNEPYYDPTRPVIVSGLSGTLPVLYINVRNDDGSLNDEIIDRNLSHKNYFAGEYWLDLNGCEWLEAEGAKSIGSEEEPLPLEIKARGNYTRTGFSKKPFKLKLAAKQSLLGMSKSKHYAILAHADDDYGFMRNFVGFNLGKRIGLPWTPSQQPVEVVINGDYRGLYFLTESIRIEKDRINITELEDLVDDPALVSGGYLVELDNYDEDNQIRMEEKTCVGGYTDMLRVTFDTPEDYSDIQRQFVWDQFSAMNDYVGSNSDRLWSYLDLDDAARYYIVEEMISHTEAYHGSTYLFRDHGAGQKWHFSPLWDCGNAFRGPTNGFFYDNSFFGSTWIPSMRCNAKFNDKVSATWKWFMSNEYDGLMEDIEAYANHIKKAAAADHLRWRNAPRPDSSNATDVCNNTDMDSKFNTVKWHLLSKIDWLKGKLGDYTQQVYPEPERDTTEAAPLPEYIVSGVNEIEAIEAEGEAEIYNLQGMRVNTPAPGELYIVRKAGRAVKIMAK